jgi:hypothetical protein
MGLKLAQLVCELRRIFGSPRVRLHSSGSVYAFLRLDPMLSPGWEDTGWRWSLTESGCGAYAVRVFGRGRLGLPHVAVSIV